MTLKTKYSGVLSGAILLVAAFACTAANPPQQASSPAVVAAMQAELDRSIGTMSKADRPAYFISYTVSDRQYVTVSGSNGALLSSSEDRGRWLEVQSRV